MRSAVDETICVGPLALPSANLAVDAGVTILFWSVLSLYLAGDLYWLYEMCRYCSVEERSYQPIPRV